MKGSAGRAFPSTTGRHAATLSLSFSFSPRPCPLTCSRLPRPWRASVTVVLHGHAPLFVLFFFFFLPSFLPSLLPVFFFLPLLVCSIKQTANDRHFSFAPYAICKLPRRRSIRWRDKFSGNIRQRRLMTTRFDACIYTVCCFRLLFVVIYRLTRLSSWSSSSCQC